MSVIPGPSPAALVVEPGTRWLFRPQQGAGFRVPPATRAGPEWRRRTQPGQFSPNWCR